MRTPAIPAEINGSAPEENNGGGARQCPNPEPSLFELAGGKAQAGMVESSGDISNPQGSQGQGPSELMRGPDWSEARRAMARSRKMAERKSDKLVS
jgi:hypothetical protein